MQKKSHNQEFSKTPISFCRFVFWEGENEQSTPFKYLKEKSDNFYLNFKNIKVFEERQIFAHIWQWRPHAPRRPKM